MKFVATFEHGRKQWCVQLIEQGPCPIVLLCNSKEEAEQKAKDFEDTTGFFCDPVNGHWVNLMVSAADGNLVNNPALKFAIERTADTLQSTPQE